MRSVSVLRGVALLALLAVLTVFLAVRADGAQIQPPIGAPSNDAQIQPPIGAQAIIQPPIGAQAEIQPPIAAQAQIQPPIPAPAAALSLWEQLVLGIQLWAKIGPPIG